jgi:hypothetical protein
VKRTPIKRKTPLKRGGRIKPKPMSALAKRKANPYSKYWQKKAMGLFMASFRGLPCEVCGTKQGTCAHHLLSQGSHPKYKLEPKNITVLCPSCHKYSNELAAHSKNVLAVERFMEWLRYNKPEQGKWLDQAELEYKDLDRVDYKQIYERLAKNE